MAAVTMRLPALLAPLDSSALRGGEKHLVAPGDTITTDTGYMRCGQRSRGGGEGGGVARLRAGLREPLSLRRGHGTYVENDKLIASVAGVVERVNKLVCVRALKAR